VPGLDRADTVIVTGILCSVGLQCGLRASLIMALSGRVTHEVVDVELM
jgi:hypothetical protein